MARKDGWVTPTSSIKRNRKEIINECLEPQPFYDDWSENRDGLRGYPDNKSIRNENMRLAGHFEVDRWNKKNKKLLKRRKVRKNHPRNDGII